MKKSNMTIGSLSGKMKKELAPFYAKRELEHLVYMVFEKIFEFSKADMVIRAMDVAPEENINEVEEVIRRMKNQEPIQHIIHTAFFMDMVLKSDSRALIPRQETEELVAWVIDEHGVGERDIIDIGTGSGCIALALAKALPLSRINALDHSSEALELAKENIALHQLQVGLLHGDILNWKNDGVLNQMTRQLDVVVSNPPYIQQDDMAQMAENVTHYEPKEALFVPNDDPLIYYKAIGEWAQSALRPGGNVYVEINEAFGNETAALFEEMGFTDVVLKKDLHGKDRMVRCTTDSLKS